MSNAPIQTILQQRDARPVSGEHLETLGKQAASNWVDGKVASLHEAVVDVVRGERLSPEQVRRVVEFTNGDAYLQEFRKLSSHRVVNFNSGPADPAQVLQDLNDGGGGSRYDRGTLDYSRGPKDVFKEAMARSADSDGDQTKTAAANAEPVEGLPKLPKLPSLPKQASANEDAFWSQFGQVSHIPFADPLQPLTEVRTKLAHALDEAGHEITQLELDYSTVCDTLFNEVKTAALQGTSLADIVTAWSVASEEPVYVKLAFDMLTPRLLQNRVVASYDAFGESLTKKASAGEVNVEHPLVHAYSEFISTLNKLAEVRGIQSELVDGVAQVDTLVKAAASGGVIGAAKKGISAASQHIDAASPAIAKFLVGAQDAAHLAPKLSKGLKATGAVGGALAANAAVQSVTDRPMVRSGLNTAQSLVPGTAAYQERRYRTMTGQ